MKVNKIERNENSINSKKDLLYLHKFENFPVFMGCTNQKKETDLLADMNWSISKNSGAIQLNPLLPLEIIYQDDHGSGCVGDLWNKHHKAFAEFVHKFFLPNLFKMMCYG